MRPAGGVLRSHAICPMPPQSATQAARGVVEQEYRCCYSAMARRRHQRDSSRQLTTTTTSTTSASHCTSKQHGSREKPRRQHDQHGWTDGRLRRRTVGGWWRRSEGRREPTRWTLMTRPGSNHAPSPALQLRPVRWRPTSKPPYLFWSFDGDGHRRLSP